MPFRVAFVVGFGIDWFTFTICTTHILYGEDGPEDPQRLEEIGVLAGFLADRAKEEYAWAKNMLLLGISTYTTRRIRPQRL